MAIAYVCQDFTEMLKECAADAPIIQSGTALSASIPVVLMKIITKICRDVNVSQDMGSLMAFVLSVLLHFS